MKSTIFNSVLALLLLTGASCHKTAVGYLMVDRAGYAVDSLVVKLQLDVTPPTEGPNPQYQQLLNFGFTPAAIAALGIKPTILLNPGPDYDRVRLGIPWTSTAMEGILGTNPIAISITKVDTKEGDPEKLKKIVSIRNNGILSIPLQNDLPAGHYLLSYTFRNEGYARTRDSIFTVIVK